MSGGGLIAWIAANEKTLVLAAAAIGGAVTVLWSKLSALRVPASWVAADKATTGGVAPKLQPEGLPTATSHEADLQAMQARFASTDAVLIETQQALKRIRAAMDRQALEAAHEEGQLSSSIVRERAENERLRARIAMLEGENEMLIAKSQSLLAEMRTLRADGPPELPRHRVR